MDAAALGWDLIRASRLGQDERVVTLLGQGADIDHQHGGTGWTALIYASFYERTSTVKLLLERGANANLTDNNNSSALNISATGHLEITHLLVAHGAVIETRDNRGNTPLIPGARRGHLAVCELLLSKAADLRVANN